MFGQESLMSFTLNASTDLSAKQYYFGKVETDGELGVQTSTGGVVCGVIQDAIAVAHAPVAVGFCGVTPIICGAVVTAGDEVTCDSAGKAITATSTNLRHGTALTTSTAAGDFVIVLLHINGSHV